MGQERLRMQGQEPFRRSAVLNVGQADKQGDRTDAP